MITDWEVSLFDFISVLATTMCPKIYFQTFSISIEISDSSEFIAKTFQAAQLIHERFLTIDHSYKIFFFDIWQTELPPTSGV